jgi:hypothetical protein
MGNPAKDPYAGLLNVYDERRKDFLFRLTTDEATFAANPEACGVAKRRGFLKGHGPRPVCSRAEQEAAAEAYDRHLIVWTDSPCLRASVPEPCDDEDIQSTIARLATITDVEAFKKSIAIPDEPPDETKTALGFRPLMRLLRQLAVCGRGELRMTIRGLLINARDGQITAPDYNPASPFDGLLIERVAESLDGPTEPEPDDTGRDELAGALTAMTIEGESAPIEAARAQSVLKGIYALLPSSLASDLVRAAINQGRPGPYVLRNALGARESPGPFGTREDPGSFGGRESPGSFGGRESPGSFGARETPPGGFESPNPRPPPPRGGNTLLRAVWGALRVFSWLGTVGTDESYTVRRAAIALAAWVRNKAAALAPESAPSTMQELFPPPVDKGATSLIQELFQDQLWIPPHTERANYPDFVWPPYTREGIYWWRTIIKPQCIEHCFALKDTADFKSTDLIRFFNLFPAPDPRIPDYVRNAVTLALLWFKYWWDEPSAKDGSGADKAEMTMWSENHQILFAQSQLLAGAMFRNFEFARSGTVGSDAPRTGQDHINEGLVRVECWLDRRLKFGFSEWNAPGYYDEDFPPLFNLVDFCNPSDPAIKDQNESAALSRIKVKASMVLDVMIFDCARFTCRGSFGATAGRAYWEKKSYGWEQSIGNTIEILFGTRGDYTEAEGSAVALATSTYDVPEALLAIGLDRAVLDQSLPFIDRTRVSLDFDNAADYGIGFESEQDILFWWGLQAYYTDFTLEATKRIVEAHDNLRECEPFKPLYSISNLKWFVEALLNLISLTLDYLKVRLGVALVAALPFPLNLVAAGIEGKSVVEGVVDFFKDLWEYLSTIAQSGPWKGLAEGAAAGTLVFGVPGGIVGGAVGFFGGLFGGGDKSDQPRIPESVLQNLLEKLLVAFTQGTVLSTANIVTYNNGDAMLSSVQNHLPGLTAFQKQPWMANLGCDACVWTSARLMAPDLGSYFSTWGRFFKDLGLLRLHEAVADVLETPALQFVVKASDLFGNNGPNYWTGSLALPMVVQHENAAIIAYNIPELQRSLSGFSTHAWFPKAMFDETSKQNSNGGTWFFGRKDHLQDGIKVGSGYVALFSAIEADWTNEKGNAWNDKEIMTKLSPIENSLTGSNIWISVVGNEKQFSDVADGKQFDTFCEEIQNADLQVSGIGSPAELKCSFDIPRATAPAGKSPRLELSYLSKTGLFAGENLQLDNFPRFENRYVTQVVTSRRPGSGLRPQVEDFTTAKGVGFGSSSYRITHPITGLTLDHDTATPARRHTSQQEEVQQKTGTKRLEDGSVVPVRRGFVRSARKHPLTRPHLDLSSIRRRIP